MSEDSRSPEEIVATVELVGFKCTSCGHSHSGKRLAYVCIGCPCGMIPDFDKITHGDDDAVLDAEIIE